jgi:hypothetical protein
MIFWGVGLLLLAFFSKLSLAFIGVPGQVSSIIFQHGLHPYLNIILNFIMGIPFIALCLQRPKNFESPRRSYRSLLFLLFVMFFIETLLQFVLMDHMKGPYAWAALSSTIWLILIFGILIPTYLNPELTLKTISTWAINFVVLSLLLWLVRPDLTFKGGRFVGVFKHIPYMVTCASVGVIFTLGRFQFEKSSLRRLWNVTGILLSFIALLMTGTRSALAAVVMALVLWMLRVPTLNRSFRFFKYSAALVLSVVLLLFGNQMMEYAKDIATGKKALVEREAQDGVASRVEEVERGWEYFQTSPWLGQGLLSKFSGKDSLEVSSYNSFKDPHNIFVSAGVVGGWPFIIWTVIFLGMLIGLSVKALVSENRVMQVFAIYALVQIPILIIYHWHLSLGGMADRFYWLVFGYLALKSGLNTKVEDRSV